MLKKIDNRNLSEIVYETIKNSIIDNAFKPGEKLDINTLTKQLGVSRTPISNAMKALEMESYVVIYPQNGTRVRELTEKELDIIYDMRELIEGLVVRVIPAIENQETLAMYRSCFERFMQIDHFNMELICEFYRLELEFHDYLTSLCPPIIQSEIKNIIDLTKRSRKLNLDYQINRMNTDFIKEGDIKLHIKLIDAILNDDRALAENYARLDVRQTKVEVWKNLYQAELRGEPHAKV